MSAPTIKSQALPLYKILLHAAKFPHNSICGLLLGSVSDEGVTVTEAVPLFHITAALAAPVEVALSQIEAYVEKSEGNLKIVGFYESDARMKTAEQSTIGRRIADRIHDKNSSAIVVLLDNTKLQSFVESTPEEPCSSPHPFEPLTRHPSTGSWKMAGQAALSMVGSKGSPDQLLEAFRSAIVKQQHHLIIDFDEHLDDISKDYLNPNVKLP